MRSARGARSLSMVAVRSDGIDEVLPDDCDGDCVDMSPDCDGDWVDVPPDCDGICDCDVEGEVEVEGDPEVDGDVEVEGDPEVEGDVEVEGDPEVGGDVEGDVESDGVCVCVCDGVCDCDEVEGDDCEPLSPPPVLWAVAKPMVATRAAAAAIAVRVLGAFMSYLLGRCPAGSRRVDKDRPVSATGCIHFRSRF